MHWRCCLPYVVTAMFLFPAAGEEPKNPWKEKVADAVAHAEKADTAAAYGKALDVAYRADDWRAGLGLARAVLKSGSIANELRGPVARALWRAGRLDDAERLIDQIDPAGADRTALSTSIEINLARGRFDAVESAADHLEKLRPRTAIQHYTLLSARLAADRLADIPKQLREAAKLIDADNGYPEIYLEEMLDGLPEFFDAIGPEPINQVVAHGSAGMPVVPLLRLPYCLATINGKGPYRFILDTGGSISLSIDDTIAEELGLESFGVASVRGVSGKQDSQQMLVEELRIGDIVCKRVMTRTFAMPEMMTVAVDGIIGTGIFLNERMTLDFGSAQLVVTPSSDKPAAGDAAKLRIVGDAKLMAPIMLQDKPAIALLDTGADVAAISPQTLEELFPDKKFTNLSAAGIGVGQGEQAGITLAPGVQLDIWGRRYENYSGLGLDALDSLLSPILGVQTQVLIGMPIFRETRTVTVDYRKRKMWVQWLE